MPLGWTNGYVDYLGSQHVLQLRGSFQRPYSPLKCPTSCIHETPPDFSSPRRYSSGTAENTFRRTTCPNHAMYRPQRRLGRCCSRHPSPWRQSSFHTFRCCISRENNAKQRTSSKTVERATFTGLRFSSRSTATMCDVTPICCWPETSMTSSDASTLYKTLYPLLEHGIS